MKTQKRGFCCPQTSAIFGLYVLNFISGDKTSRLLYALLVSQFLSGNVLSVWLDNLLASWSQNLSSLKLSFSVYSAKISLVHSDIGLFLSTLNTKAMSQHFNNLFNVHTEHN